MCYRNNLPEENLKQDCQAAQRNSKQSDNKKLLSAKLYQLTPSPQSVLVISRKTELPNYTFTSNIKPISDKNEYLKNNFMNYNSLHFESSTFNGDGYAGSRFHNPPKPNTLPKPPIHWINGSDTLNHVLYSAYLDSIAIDLKDLLHVQA